MRKRSWPKQNKPAEGRDSHEATIILEGKKTKTKPNNPLPLSTRTYKMFLKIQGHKTLNKSQEIQSSVLNYTSLNHSVPPRNPLYGHQAPLSCLYSALNLAFLTEYFVCNNKTSLLQKSLLEYI